MNKSPTTSGLGMGSDRHSRQTFKAGDGSRSMFEPLESRLLLSADNGLRAVYYDNMDFTNPVLSRVDTNINFNWASGSPDARVGADTFSARWTGKIVPLYTETYTFTTYSDDGVRLWINGKNVIDSWIGQDGSIPRTGTIDLEAGRQYDLQLDYFENTDGAKVELNWQSASQTYQAVPSSQLLLGDEGLRADYFDDESLTAADWQFTRNEAVNFDWGYGSPAASMGPETFSARWAGQIIPQFTEQYAFYVDRDGGSRLWVNNALLIDNWDTPAGGEASATINLTAGQKTSIKLEYRETTGLAKTKLSWSSASTTKQVIPDTQLYPFSAPIDITSGGTYIGSWESLDPAVEAVRVNTVDPVTIDHSTVRSRSGLIRAGSYVNHTKTTVLNTSGYALNPNVYGQAPGRFFAGWAYDSVILEHNYMEGTSGIYLNGNLYRGTTATILYNSALNIDSRKSDGNGGYLDFEARTPKAGGATEYGHINGHFVLFNGSRDMVNTEIAWNQVINEVGKSRVEDNINMYLSSGTAASPILIHDNYINGAYSIAPWMTGTTEDANYTYNWSYAGSGILPGDGFASVAADATAYLDVYNNQVVGTRKGISVAAGHDINVHDNYLLDNGYLPDGQYSATMTSGMSVYDGYNTGSGVFYNNIASNNQVGWMQRSATSGASMYLYYDKMAFGAGWFRDANGINYTGDALPSFEWYQVKMQMDFTANSGQGAGTLYHRSDTDDDGDFTDETWVADSMIANVNLGLSTAPLDGRNPKNWGQVRYRSDTTGGQLIDDMLVSVGGTSTRLSINFESPTYTTSQPLARDYTDNNPAGQDGWTDVGTGNFGTVVASPAGKSGSQAAGGVVNAWRAAPYGFTGGETDVQASFYSYSGIDGRNDWWLPGAVPGYTNTAITGPLTAQMEADVFTAWQDKLATNAATLGPITPAPDVDPATRFLIDFESPTYSLGQNLVGQDGWTTSYSGPGSIVATPGPINGTQVVQGSYNGSKLVPYNFTGSETNAQLTFFGYSGDNYLGPRVSFYNDYMAFTVVPRASVRDANGVTTQGDTHPANTWVQERIVMDFTANSGQGAATVYTRYDVNGNGIFTDEAWVIDSVLQNINLGLSTSPTDGRNPANWHYLRLRIDGSTGMADNIQLTVDSDPAVTVAALDSAASEAGPDTAAFRITRTGFTSDNLTVNYTLAGAATNGGDYNTLTGSAFITAGQTYVDVVVTPIDDAMVELTEDVTLTLQPDPLYALGAGTQASVTIADNDTLSLPTSLTTYFRLDEGTGTAVTDTAPSGSTAGSGTLTNGPLWTAGQIGNAVQLDGTNDYVSVTDSTGSDLDVTRITASVWVKASAGSTSYNKSYCFLSKASAYSMGATANNSRTVAFRIYIGSSAKTATYTIPSGVNLDQWHLFTGTYDGTNVRLYMNGSPVATSAATTGNITVNNNTFYLGRISSNYFRGSLDEARIYNTAMNAADIAALYNQPVLGITDLTVNSPNGSSYSVQNNALSVGDNPYGDNAATFTSIPTKYLGSTYIQTANADANTTGSNLITLTVNQPVTIHILYNDAYATRPAWLTGSGFTDTSDNIVTTAGTFSVFSKTLSAGTITLGGNTDDGLGTYGMYGILITPLL